MLHTLVKILLRIIFVLVSFGQLTRISVPGQPIFFYLFEPLVFVCTILMALKLKQKLKGIKVLQMTGVFLGWMLFSLIVSLLWYSPQDNIVAFLYFIRLTTYLVFIALSIPYLKTFVGGGYMKILLYLVSAWVVVSSIIQYALYPNLGNLAYLGWDPHLYRMVGLFFDPPMTVSVFVLIALYFATCIPKNSRAKALAVFMIVLLSILSFLTYSRGGYVGIMALVVAFVAQQKNLRIILVAAGLLIFGFLLIPKGQSEGVNLWRTTSIEARINDYQKAITIWKQSPISGIGYNHIRPEKDVYESQAFYGPYNPSHGSSAFHSSFLVILVTGGVIGLVLFGWLLIAISMQSHYLLCSVICLSVISFFDNVLLHPFMMVLVGVIGGLHARHHSSRS